LYLKKWKTRYAELSESEKSEWDQWYFANKKSPEAKLLKKTKTVKIEKNA